jgi:ABC-type polysaccharide/polyol phosphate export permease
MWFFVSPTLYSVDMVPKGLKTYMNLNPMTHILTAYRDAVLYDRTPNLAALGVIALISVALLLGGIKLIARYQGDYAKVL